MNDASIKRILDGFDQLTVAKRRKEIFDKYKEAEIKFKPTYRILVCSFKYVYILIFMS